MEVHQVIVGAALGDAITTEALLLQQALRAAGHRSELFGYHRDETMASRVRHITEYERVVDSSDAVIVLHASISERAVFELAMRRLERLVVRYHNITPAEFFAPWDPDHAVLLARGREELRALRDRAAAAIAVSRFNEAELLALGYTKTSVVPLLTSVGALLEASSSQLSLPPSLAGAEGPMLLFVGRVAPNKGHVACMQALHVLQTYHNPRAQLVFAGGGEVAAYRAMLNRGAGELGLRCVFTGKVSVAELAALYRRAAVFLCMSEHEGFCAPVVEAMALGLPVVARAAAAVPETLADAGVLLADDDPSIAAEAVLHVLDDAGLRTELIERGRARAATLAPEVITPRLVDAVLRSAA